MKVLGLSCYYHDSAAALLDNGVVVAGAEEERFTRRKHDSEFPIEAIRYCLESTGTKGSDLSQVVFYDKPLKKLERALSTAKAHGEAGRPMAEWHISNFVHREASITRDIQAAIGHPVPVRFCEHHLSHAASAFFSSPYEDAAILTVDGVGEWATTGLYHGTADGIRQISEIRYPHSIGLFYATMTSWLGFEVNEGEYKVMGLASYGKPTFNDEVSKLITLHEDGSFTNNMEYYSYTYDDRKMYSPKLIELLGPARDSTEPVTERHMNMAASLQKLCEDALVNLARGARKMTGADHLVLSGGVAHNVVANTRLIHESGFPNVWIHPASGDSGGAIGAALYGHFQAGGHRHLTSSYDTCIGPSFTNEQIEAELKAQGASYEQFASDELPKRTAQLLADNFIIGWFQGRMEFGPRALGCRSILANPTNPEMKDILNARVKFREDFRPFAPAVLEEHSEEYFEHVGKSPYMLFCPQVRPEKKAAIPAVTHVDGSARVQTVSRETNPRFHELISALRDLNGVPVVVNTSFNVRGEPIVCTPADAIRCFNGTDIDFLVIGDFIVEKSF